MRGTLNATDVLTDLAAGAAPFGGGACHRGVLEAAHRVFAAVQVTEKEEEEEEEEETRTWGGGLGTYTMYYYLIISRR